MPDEARKKWMERGWDLLDGLDVVFELLFEFGGATLKFLGHALEILFELIVGLVAGLFQ